MRTLRLTVIAALLIQVYALYLHTPGDSDRLSIPGLDKVVHAAIFALPAALGVLARLPSLSVGVVLVAHAVVSEFIQHRWLPERSGDPWDALADVLGVVLGLCVGGFLLRRSSVGGVGRRD